MNLDERKRVLRERLSLLADRVSRIESHLRDPGSKDSQERAIELENEEVYERLDEAERGEIEAIRAALGRIDAGSYGTCATCGEAIAPQRLEALPYTSVCVDCAA